MKLKVRTCLVGCLVLTVFGTMNCSKKNPLNPLGVCGANGWTESVSRELNDWSTASINYSNDPTPENCTAFKNAAKNYLDALEGVRACVAGVNRADFDNAIDEAKQDVDETDCEG